MLFCKSKFWVSIVCVFIILIPIADGQISDDLKSDKGENYSKPYSFNLIEELNEKLSSWKLMISEAIGVDESSLDLDLAKEIFAEVAAWYVENLNDLYERFPNFPLSEQFSSCKLMISDAIGVEESSLDFELAKEIFIEVAAWYAENLNDLYDRFPTLVDLKIDIFTSGKTASSYFIRRWKNAQENVELYNQAYNTPMTSAAAALVSFYTVFTLVMCTLIRRSYRPHALYPADINLALAGADDARRTCVYDFEVLQVLGGGSFCRLAIVSRKHKATKITTKFAVKIMSMNAIPLPGFFSLLNPLNWILPNRIVNQGIHIESSALKSLIDSPFLTGCACAKMARDSVYYFLEVPQGNTLKSLLIQNGPFEKLRLRFIAAELISAVHNMHAHGMTCGDIDPDTVILGNDGHVKLMSSGLLSMNIEKLWTLRNDTPTALASNKPLDFDQDWNNLGQCLLWMLTGKQPDTDDNGQVNKSALSNLSRMFGNDITSLIKELLAQGSENSMTKSYLRNHAFFSGLDWDVVESKKELSPLFLAHDLEANDVHFSADALVKDNANKEIEEVVRYLQGIGNYKVRSL